MTGSEPSSAIAGTAVSPPASSDAGGGAAAPPALQLVDLTKRFGDLVAMDSVSLSVMPGTVHCLLGENGAGKSTLCNVVFGVYRADGGEMAIGGEPFAPREPADSLKHGIAMVHQHFSLVPTLGVAENLLLGPLRWKLPLSGARRRATELAERYGFTIDVDTPVGELSVGERQRAEIIKCLARDPKLLVLDEPSAVLAPAEIEGLLTLCRRIAAEGHAVLLVTHKLAEVRHAGDHATVLRHGKVAASLPMADATSAQLVELMVGRSADSLDPALAAALGIGWAAEAEAGGTAAPTAPARTRHHNPAGTSAGPALEIRGVTVRTPGDDAPRLDDVTLHVEEGEIVGLAGVEGNGQSELARVLAGVVRPDGGTVRLSGEDVTAVDAISRAQRGLAVIPEDRRAEGVIEGMSVAENLALGDLRAFRRLGIVRRGPRKRRAQDLMQEFDIRATGPDTDVATLSGGNQQKVVVARELSRDPLRFVLAVQPTRGLDVGAVNAVVDRLRDAADEGVGVLIVSSELPELIAVCDRIAVIYRGAINGEVAPDDPDAVVKIGALMAGETT
ncbi:MAG: ABC transporter ATP-binding protein [Solirubrobacteraceae bacterium]|nr:ABC transporter ATP-binding protein [Solirubrobacteraceae bacterium]